MSTKPLRFVGRPSVSHLSAGLGLVGMALAALALAACTDNEAGSAQSSASGSGGSGEGGGPTGSGAGGAQGDGGSGSTSVVTSSSTGGDGGAGTTSAASSASASASAASSSSSGAGTGGGPEQIAEVFAHSSDTLYRVDLETNEVETIGDFDGCGSIVDIALDKDSQLYGVSYEYLYRIDKETAECDEIADGDFPNSLSFVPAGTLDPDEEQLVGYVGTDYVRIDKDTGDREIIGEDALTNGLQSSGDIVSVIDGPTLLTVKGGACDATDCVVRVDPVTGAILENLGSCSYNDVFGIAFWDGSLYGFTTEGDAFEFVGDGNGGFDVVPIPVSGVEQFYGAGSTTSAPKGD